jgi:uridine kinase
VCRATYDRLVPGYDLTAITAAIEACRRPGGVRVVAVDGPSGSGKTRLARRLARALGDSTLIRMDHLVPGWDGLEESTDLVRPPLQRLRAGESTSYRVWDWSAEGWGAPLIRKAAPNIVVEGCGSGALRLSALVDYLIFVDAPSDVRLRRAIARDGATYEPHWQRWAAQEDAHFAANRTRERADLLIDGRLPVR